MVLSHIGILLVVINKRRGFSYLSATVCNNVRVDVHSTVSYGAQWKTVCLFVSFCLSVLASFVLLTQGPLMALTFRK